MREGDMLEKLLRLLDAWLGHLSTLLGGGALLLSFFAVLTRYFFPSYALNWSAEIIIFMVMWTVFLGAGRLAFRDAHIGTDSFLGAVSIPVRNAAILFATLLGISMAVMLVWSGIIVVKESIRWDERTASLLRMPLWIYYISLPIGFGSVALFLVGRLLGARPEGEAAGHNIPIEE